MDYNHIITWILTYIVYNLHLNLPVGAQDSVYSTCSGQGLQKLDPEGYITSPGYPAKYKPSVRCTWNIVLPKTNRVRIQFLDMDLDKPRFHTGCHDMVQIYNSKQEELERLCGDLSSLKDKRLMYVNDNKVAVRFRTYHDTVPRTGFKVHYSPLPCPPVPLTEGSFIESHDNNTATVTCKNGVREPITCNRNSWIPDLQLLGKDCVIVTPAPIQKETTKNQTAYHVVPGPEDTGDNDNGAVIGAVVGCIILLIIIVAVIIFIIYKKRRVWERRGYRGKQTNGIHDTESNKPLARPDVITIVPNYSEPTEGEYTEPVDDAAPLENNKSSTPDYVNKTKTPEHKSSTKSHHSYDLPYHVKNVDIQKEPERPSNTYDLPHSKSAHGNFYDRLEEPEKTENTKAGDSGSSSSGPDYPAPPTPAPPPLPKPNKTPIPATPAAPASQEYKAPPPPLPTTVPRKIKPRPKSMGTPVGQITSTTTTPVTKPSAPVTKPPAPVTKPPTSVSKEVASTKPEISKPIKSPYEDDPTPYACVDIINVNNPAADRKGSPALPEDDPPISSFRVPHTRKL